MNEDVTVVVSSCDKYEDAWEPFFRLFYIMEAGGVFPNIVLNTEAKQFKCDYLHIRTINTPWAKTWSERLLNVLEQIETEFIFHVLDDFFIQSPFQEKSFADVMDYMRSHPDVGAMHLTPNGRFPAGACDMFLERKFDKLNITVTCVVWRRDFLMKLLRRHENIWQFEWYSTFRAKKFFPDVKIMQYNEAYPCIFNYSVNIAEGYGITGGKWLPENKGLFDKYGIEVNFDRLGVSNMDYKNAGSNTVVKNNPYHDDHTLKGLIMRTIYHFRNKYHAWKSLH